MPTVAENGKGEHEEESMDQDDVESSKSSEEETASGSGMEGEEECEEDGDESTEMDEDECDKKRAEYLDDLAELDRQFIELKDQEAIKRKFESEELAAYQHMQSEKILLFDSLKQELQDKIRRLEEDRNNIDIYSGNQAANAEAEIRIVTYGRLTPAKDFSKGSTWLWA
ncbi:hypothetical protein C0Q70_14252 [Pomacea canaliculata]|uniref:Uncharacterized protein n=1 Tax=Pomacea canaliculata TaxID=400727 RepID=A0A2T7NZH4_POMCA|nr:hypothetical protein C0Q70_14252 [Pomacea canaliculata]